MTLLSKITEIGNSIIALNNTRANKDLSNLTPTGEGKLGCGVND